MKKIGVIFWDWLLKIQRFLMIVTGIAVVCLVFGPLVLREIGHPFVGYEEYLLTVAFWMYMFGSSHGSYEKSQITADLLSRVLKGKPKMLLNLTASILTFILGVILTYWALVLVQWSLKTGSMTSVYRIPVVVGQFSILVGLSISSFYNLVYMIKDIIDTKKMMRPRVAQTSETASQEAII